jgi:hypothetical protein
MAVLRVNFMVGREYIPDVLLSKHQPMRALVRILLAFVILCAGVCPAYCVASKHDCCSQTKQKNKQQKPCTHASVTVKVTPQVAITPAAQNLTRALAPVFEPAPLIARTSTPPPPHRLILVLRT